MARLVGLVLHFFQLQLLPSFLLQIEYVSASPLFSISNTCPHTRTTGYSNMHRTLRIPTSMWPGLSASNDATTVATALAQVNQLCCVFTHVDFNSTAVTIPTLIAYDGSMRTYGSATTFAGAASQAYAAICGMSMGSNDCASAASRCPTPRGYDAHGMLCRPINNNGYKLTTGVASAAACRAQCDAESTKCGAFEYEYTAGDDRECELHEKTIVSTSQTAAMGSCLLEVVKGGASPSIDAVLYGTPVMSQHRCCWILSSSGTSSITSSSSTSSSGASTSVSSSTSTTSSSGTSTSKAISSMRWTDLGITMMLIAVQLWNLV